MFQRSAARHLIQANQAQRGFVAHRLAALGLHVGQEQLLMRLWEQDGISQSDLQAKIGCTAPTLTKGVQRLERIGLVRRERGGRPRVSRVYVTEAGWRLRESVEEVWRAAEQRLAAAMSAEEYASFVAMLERVTCTYAGAADAVRPVRPGTA